MNDSDISHYRAPKQDQASSMGGSTQCDAASPHSAGGAPPHIHPIVGGGAWQGTPAPARHGGPACLGLLGRGPPGDPPEDPPGPPAPPETSTTTATPFPVSNTMSCPTNPPQPS